MYTCFVLFFDEFSAECCAVATFERVTSSFRSSTAFHTDGWGWPTRFLNLLIQASNWLFVLGSLSNVAWCIFLWQGRKCGLLRCKNKILFYFVFDDSLQKHTCSQSNQWGLHLEEQYLVMFPSHYWHLGVVEMLRHLTLCKLCEILYWFYMHWLI